MKKLLGLVPILLVLAGCGGSDTATEESASTSEDPEEVNLVITAPGDDSTVRGRTVVVRGTVGPPEAVVEVNGDAVRVRGDGSFAKRVSLPDLGPNFLTVSAEAEGFDSTEEDVSITRERTARELALVRERRRARRERELAALRSSAVTIPYNQLEKNPERHAGKKVKYTGQIFQIQEEGSSTIILLAVTHDPVIDFWDDNVWVNYEGTINSAEDDVITIFGEVLGTRSYETQIGGETFVPEIDAEIIDE